MIAQRVPQIYDTTFGLPLDVNKHALDTTIVHLNPVADGFTFVFGTDTTDVPTLRQGWRWLLADPAISLGASPVSRDWDAERPEAIDHRQAFSFTSAPNAERQGPYTVLTRTGLPPAARMAKLSINVDGGFESTPMSDRIAVIEKPITRVGLDELEIRLETSQSPEEEVIIGEDRNETCQERNDRLRDEGVDTNDLELCDPETGDEKEEGKNGDDVVENVRFEHRDYWRTIVGLELRAPYAKICKNSPEKLSLAWGERDGDLDRWRQEAVAGLDPKGYGPSQTRRLRELEKKSRKTDKRLKEAQALLTLQKKVSALWGDEDADTTR